MTEKPSAIWKRFVDALRLVWSEQPTYPHQEQFLAVRDVALRLAESEEMASEIDRAFGPAREASAARPAPQPREDPRDIVLLELDSFPRAVGIYQSESAASPTKASARKSICSIAKTILGSVQEVASVSAFGKAALEVLKEVSELLGHD